MVTTMLCRPIAYGCKDLIDRGKMITYAVRYSSIQFNHQWDHFSYGVSAASNSWKLFMGVHSTKSPDLIGLVLSGVAFSFANEL